jgi:hypothetical protein
MRQSNFFRVMLAAFAAATLYGQENSIRMDGGPSWKGFSIRFSPRVEPDSSDVSNELGGTVIDLRGGIVGQRFIDDPAHKRSFGYDVRLEPAPDGNSARIRIEPLHGAQHAVQSGWTQFGLPAGLPKYPVIPDLKVGDTVVLDLLLNPATGQKIVDYLTLIRTDRPDPKRAHDFSLADVTLSLDRPRVLVNGKRIESTGNFLGGAAASVVWIYIRGHGRFILSLFPNEKLGFQKNGLTGANALTFRDGATEFRVECSSSVAPGPGDGAYNLYVIHEPAWQPRSREDQIEVGSGDDAQSIVGKH